MGKKDAEFIMNNISSYIQFFMNFDNLIIQSRIIYL